MSLVLLFGFPSFIHMMLIFCHQRGRLMGKLSFNVNLIKLEFRRCCWLPFSFVYLKFIEQLIWYKIEFHYLTAIFTFLGVGKFSKTTNQKWWKIMVLWYGRRRENVQKSRQNFYREILEIPRQTAGNVTANVVVGPWREYFISISTSLSNPYKKWRTVRAAKISHSPINSFT